MHTALREDGCWRFPSDNALQFVWVERPSDERRARVDALGGKDLEEEAWEPFFVQTLLADVETEAIETLEAHFASRDAFAAATEALGERHWPRLRRLVLALLDCGPRAYDELWSNGEPSPLVGALHIGSAAPSLETLTIEGHWLLGGLVHPTLRRLEVRGEQAVLGVGLETAQDLIVELPSLTELALRLESPESDGYWPKNLDFGQTPGLEHLDLRGSDFWVEKATEPEDTVTLLRAIATANLPLKWLGLPVLRTNEGLALERVAPALRDIETIVTTEVESPLSEAITRLLPNLSVEEPSVDEHIEWLGEHPAFAAASALPPPELDTLLPDLAAARSALLLRSVEPSQHARFRQAEDEAAARLAAAVRFRDWVLCRQITRSIHPEVSMPEQAIMRLGGREGLVPANWVPTRHSGRTATCEDNEVVVSGPAGEELTRLDRHVTPLGAPVLSPSGEKVASAGRDERVMVWNVTRTDAPLLLDVMYPARCLDFLGEDHLALAHDDGIELWSLESQRCCARLFCATPRQIVCSDDARVLVSHGGARLLAWRLDAKDALPSLLAAPLYQAHTLCFLGSTLLAVDDERYFDLVHGKEVRLPDAAPGGGTLAFSSDGSKLLTGNNGVVWDVDTGLPRACIELHGRVGAIAMTERFIVAELGTRVVAYSLASGALLADLTGECECSGVALTADGLVVVGKDQHIALVDPEDWSERWRVPTDDVWAATIAASADGRWIACGSYASMIALVDRRGGKLARILWGIDNPVRGVASDWPRLENLSFSDDSAEISSGLYRWKTETGERLPGEASLRQRALGSDLEVRSADGRLMAQARRRSPTVEVYRAGDGGWDGIAQLFLGDRFRLKSLAFTPDADRLIVSGAAQAFVFGLPCEETPVTEAPPRPPGLPDEARWDPHSPGFEWIVGDCDDEGRRHGDYRAWNTAGMLHAKSTYVHGELHGENTVYHPDGSVASVGEWREGLLFDTRVYRAHCITGEEFAADAAANVWEARFISDDGISNLTQRYFGDRGNEVATNGAPLPPRPEDVAPTARYIPAKKKWVDGRVLRRSGLQIGRWRWWTAEGVLAREEQRNDEGVAERVVIYDKRGNVTRVQVLRDGKLVNESSRG